VLGELGNRGPGRGFHLRCDGKVRSPGLSLPSLDPNPDRFWTFEAKRLDLAWWVSEQKFGLGSQKLGPIRTRYGGLDRFFFWTPPQHLQKALKSSEIIMINAKYVFSSRIWEPSHQPIMSFLGRFGAEKGKWLGAIRTRIDQKCPDRKNFDFLGLYQCMGS
jgi:hypothetical protein